MRTCRIVAFAVSADYRVKLKECEKRDKYLHLARELKKLWNMKVMIIPIVIGALGTVTKGLIQGLGDFEITRYVETIQTTTLWDWPEYWEEVWRLSVTQTPVRNHQLMLVWKTLKREQIIIIIIIRRRQEVRMKRERWKKEKNICPLQKKNRMKKKMEGEICGEEK